MFTLSTILTLLFLHWFADFVCQTREMANNKSKSVKWLSIHVLVYSAFFIIISPMYALINGILHWITDFTTSKITSHYWKEQKIKAFFTTIGFDQFIHAASLFLTYWWLFL